MERERTGVAKIKPRILAAFFLDVQAFARLPGGIVGFFGMLAGHNGPDNTGSPCLKIFQY